MKVFWLKLLFITFSFQTSKIFLHAVPFYSNEIEYNNGWLEDLEDDQIYVEEDPVHLKTKLRMFSNYDQDITNENGFFFEGDIASPSELDGRKALSDPTYKWPEAIIPFKIDSSVSNTSEPLILSAMKEWNNATCIQFRPYNKTDQNYILIKTNQKGCWSFVGDHREMFNGQPLSLGSGCLEKHTILHELGHAIGLFHEQSRSDRDETIEVLWDNLSQGYSKQFYKANDFNYSIKYDVLSVMQYPTWGFSKSMFKLNSVVTKNIKLQNLLGKGRKLTFRDIKVVNLLYNCSAGCINELNCTNGGYLSPAKDLQECFCVCPPTHTGELCETLIKPNYYESMNIKFCGGFIDEEKIIEQPANNTPCSWHIEAPKNQIIKLEFEKFSLKPRFVSKTNNSLINNRCVFESLELRKENQSNGEHYCGDDIYSGQKFFSVNNILVLVVHTFDKLITQSNGFIANVTFLNNTNVTDLTF